MKQATPTTLLWIYIAALFSGRAVSASVCKDQGKCVDVVVGECNSLDREVCIKWSVGPGCANSASQPFQQACPAGNLVTAPWPVETTICRSSGVVEDGVETYYFSVSQESGDECDGSVSKTDVVNPNGGAHYDLRCGARGVTPENPQCSGSSVGYGCVWSVTIPACTATPTKSPSKLPTSSSTLAPSVSPTHAPSTLPTDASTKEPSVSPTSTLTQTPTKAPNNGPSTPPTTSPSGVSTPLPTSSTNTNAPTATSMAQPTARPTEASSGQGGGNVQGEDFSILFGAMGAVGAAAVSIVSVVFIYRRKLRADENNMTIYESKAARDYNGGGAGYGRHGTQNFASAQNEIQRELTGQRSAVLSMVAEASPEEEGVIRKSIAKNSRKPTTAQKAALARFLKETDPGRDDVTGTVEKLADTYTFVELKRAIKVRYGKLPKGWRTGSGPGWGGSSRSLGSGRFSGRQSSSKSRTQNDTNTLLQPPPPPSIPVAQRIDDIL